MMNRQRLFYFTEKSRHDFVRIFDMNLLHYLLLRIRISIVFDTNMIVIFSSSPLCLGVVLLGI